MSFDTTHITTDTDTHDHTPEDDETDDRYRWRGGRERLSEGCEDDDNQFEAIHLLSSIVISKPAESDLTQDSPARSGNLAMFST